MICVNVCGQSHVVSLYLHVKSLFSFTHLYVHVTAIEVKGDILQNPLF